MTMPALEEWLETGSHTRCPVPGCLDLDVRVRLREQDGEAYWEYLCFACGTRGRAQMKTPQEHGKWVDGHPSPGEQS
jgi:hypothetical protein